jgi:hypothetical protein
VSEKSKKAVEATTVRDTLFGDLPLDYWAAVDCAEIPWTLFKDARESIHLGKNQDAIEKLKAILALPGLESRHYLQAYFFLNELGNAAEGKLEVFGIVLEVAMPEGLDLLAIYADHSARYYNFSGRSVIWQTTDDSLDDRIEDILYDGLRLVEKIGPWKEARLPAPATGMARINFLTSHGLHFGEAAQSVLFTDAMAGRILQDLTKLRDSLIAKLNQPSEIN